LKKSLIEQALGRNKGSIKDTLEDLSLPRKTLYDKLKKYGLSREDFLAED
jgi:two-component system C4-dicarboxylate transport response regulator DctD